MDRDERLADPDPTAPDFFREIAVLVDDEWVGLGKALADMERRILDALPRVCPHGFAITCPHEHGLERDSDTGS